MNINEIINEIFTDFSRMNEEEKFIFLMSCEDADLAKHLRLLSTFIENLLTIRGQFWYVENKITNEICFYLANIADVIYVYLAII